MDFSVTAEHEAFVATARQFAGREVYPRALVAEAAKFGLMGVRIPAEYGGAGRDAVAYALAIEAVALASATLAVILAVNNSLVAEPIHEHGTPAQKDAWLSKLASGQAIGAFALSEANAGSDAANQETTAKAEGGGYVLTGRKVWVANAEVADVVVVFAVTRPGARGKGISAFLVPTAADGVTRTACDSLGVRGLGCMDLRLEGVRVGADALLGEKDRGFRIAMRALESGRVAIAAQALGIGQAALDQALAYSRQREAFGQPIGNFQAIQFQLADLATDLEAARMLTWRAASTLDSQPTAALEAAMAKLQASEAAHRAADRAMQILASVGYRRGSTIERLFRDVRAAEIYQGTSEVQRMLIAEALLG
jgi:butyryl-CoA dehydrogenase